MKYIINGKTRNHQEDAVYAFLDLPEKMRHDIIRDVLQWAGITALPMAGDAPIEWLVDFITAADCGEDFIWSALARMVEAAKASGKDEGTNRLFARP